MHPRPSSSRRSKTNRMLGWSYVFFCAEESGNMRWRSLGPDRPCMEKSVSSLQSVTNSNPGQPFKPGPAAAVNRFHNLLVSRWLVFSLRRGFVSRQSCQLVSRHRGPCCALLLVMNVRQPWEALLCSSQCDRAEDVYYETSTVWMCRSNNTHLTVVVQPNRLVLLGWFGSYYTWVDDYDHIWFRVCS